MNPPEFSVREVRLFERSLRLRMPFRFGIVTLTEAPQCFVRVRVEAADGASHWGAAAEMLAPKWFDKSPALTNEENFDQLRLSLRIAAEGYMRAAKPLCAFGHFAANYDGQIAEGRAHGLNPLVACFGPALLDRAVLDALCRSLGISFYEALRSNVAGMDSALLAETADLRGFDMSAFLKSLAPSEGIAARHTVGLVDVIAGHPNQVSDGLPESLEEVVDAYGHRFFKLKVGPDNSGNIERLAEIASVLDRIPEPYFASLDGNEQFESHEGVLELWRGIRSDPRLRRLAESILFIEQPIARSHAFDADMSELSKATPVIIDESDEDLTVFPRARALGYSGVSSKSCKGLYKSFLNAARCRMWNAESGGDRYFMTGEDLTMQAGIAVQQDLALVSLLGLTHVERNGHHYANGMASAPAAEQDAFHSAHPDLYERSRGAVRLRIEHGRLAIGSLDCPGFATAASPDWDAMEPMPERPAPQASTG